MKPLPFFSVLRKNSEKEMLFMLTPIYMKKQSNTFLFMLNENQN